MNGILYQAQNISFAYQAAELTQKVLHEVSFEIVAGEFLGMTGPSGSGKSTLLNILGLIEPMQEGQLHFLGNDLQQIKEQEKNRIRKYELGFIFQDFHLLEMFTVLENVTYFLIRQKIKESIAKLTAMESLERVGLLSFKDKYPNQLSGGQRQRVAIARALAKKPKVIIADEPTASLDSKSSINCLEILKELNQQDRLTVIMASHDPLIQKYLSREISLMDGKILESKRRNVHAC
ncbi:MAG: ABC transporter ATP-binding protein [Oligoflexus sp.]